jgi:hypothetical protein
MDAVHRLAFQIERTFLETGSIFHPEMKWCGGTNSFVSLRTSRLIEGLALVNGSEWNNQNIVLFIRGNAVSGAPSINGTCQFPKPPVIIGITVKKIIMKA